MRTAEAKASKTKERTECKDDGDSDEEWWYSCSRKTRDTREANTAECCQEHGDTITFRVIDNEKGQGFGQITWGATRPLRRCLMLLQLRHGDDAHDVCPKHNGKLVDANLSPLQADIRQGQTLTLLRLPCTKEPVKRIHITRKKDEPDDDEGNKNKRHRPIYIL